MIPVSSESTTQDAGGSPSDGWMLLAGSYTEPYGAFRAVGEGLSLLHLSTDGRLALVDRLALPNPSYCLPAANRPVQVVLETDDARAAVASVKVAAGRLHHERTLAIEGRIPCHLDRHPEASWLAAACYGSGHVIAWRVDAQGYPQRAGQIVFQRRGRSAHPQRQTMAHPHAVRFSPDGQWLLLADLGTDELVVYPFDTQNGPETTPAYIWRAPPGSGPRLPLFSHDGRYVVLVNEISSRLVSFRFKEGRLEEIGSACATIAPFDGVNTTAGLRWHPSGSLLAASNRGANSICLFHFDQQSGALSPWCAVSSGGIKPRDFCFAPCGNWLVTTNQDSDNLMIYAIDHLLRRIEPRGEYAIVRSPSTIRVV